MAPVQRREFYATPEGGAFLQAATNFANLRGQMEAMDETTDPEEHARLQQQVAVGLQAIDRGSILPPIPMKPDDFNINPQYDPEIPDYLGPDLRDRIQASSGPPSLASSRSDQPSSASGMPSLESSEDLESIATSGIAPSLASATMPQPEEEEVPSLVSSSSSSRSGTSSSSSGMPSLESAED